MKLWWCMGCQGEVKLDKHGRCEICESEAVVLIAPRNEVTGSVSMTPTAHKSKSAGQ
jgi:rRNA maturation endonuclease Nob1